MYNVYCTCTCTCAIEEREYSTVEEKKIFPFTVPLSVVLLKNGCNKVRIKNG